MEWRRFVTYLWNDPRISHDRTIAEVMIIAIVTNTGTRHSTFAMIADHTAYRIYDMAAELNQADL